MARYTGPKRKLSRREGMALFRKDEKVMERKGALPPGVHSQKGKRKLSNFGQQLREKQKTKRIYGVLERQFRRYLSQISQKRGQRGEALLQILETRLDNIIYRLGFCPSRAMARQLVVHGQVLVSGKKVNTPSYNLKPDETISLKTKALEIPAVKKSLSENKDIKLPEWLDRKAAVGKMIRLPQRDEIEENINEQQIIEFYSR